MIFGGLADALSTVHTSVISLKSIERLFLPAQNDQKKTAGLSVIKCIIIHSFDKSSTLYHRQVLTTVDRQDGKK